MLLAILILAFGWLKLIWADSAYSGPLEDDVRSIPRHRKVKLEIVKRSDDVKGFKVLPKQWIACGCLRCAPAVERTFGWLIQSRRLVRDYEAKISHSEFMIHLSMTKRMLARITCWLFLRQPLSNGGHHPSRDDEKSTLCSGITVLISTVPRDPGPQAAE